MISETAHIGDRRGPWVRELEACATDLTAEGIPLSGICLYPIQSMPEWHNPEVWLPMGLWEPACEAARKRSRFMLAHAEGFGGSTRS